MKFSIRDLLLVTVIVALAAGWGVEFTKVNKGKANWGNQAKE